MDEGAPVPQAGRARGPLDLARERDGVAVPALDEGEVRVVDAREVVADEELAPRQRHAMAGAAPVDLADEPERVVELGRAHRSTRSGAPYGASTSGTSPPRFSRIASAIRSTTAVPFSVCTGSTPRSPR